MQMKSHAARCVDWSSPCGGLTIASLDGELLLCDWTSGWHAAKRARRIDRLVGCRFEPGSSPLIERTIQELEEYFAGRRRSFEDIPLRLAGTNFQQRVWRALLSIPYGKTATYGEIAHAAGSPAAVRATGVAVGDNPFSIIVPCHRVIGRDGSLVGYGGGYKAKKLLLALELGCPVEQLPYPMPKALPRKHAAEVG